MKAFNYNLYVQCFQESSQLIPNVYNMHANNEFGSIGPQPTNVQAEAVQTPPPFLSGVPMVNPGNYAVPNYAEKAPINQEVPAPTTLPFSQQSIAQQPPIPQQQSVVSNMAAYSSSK